MIHDHALCKVDSRAWQRVYQEIGSFLHEQHLEPEPSTYRIAYRVITEPLSELAVSVRSKMEDGVRLTQRDFQELGLERGSTQRPAEQSGMGPEIASQLEILERLSRSLATDTETFGSELDTTIQLLRDSGGGPLAERVAEIAALLSKKVRHSEHRLRAASAEAGALRERLTKAETDARRDPLTTLLNRRGFDEVYGGHLDRRAPICIALCDIDHFKHINDQFGHDVGDRVLRTVAETLSTDCSKGTAARIGGEEFALIFEETEVAAAGRSVDRARRGLAARNLRVRESGEPVGQVSFSAGVTKVLANEQSADALKRADILLYEAKASGRNRVIVR